MKMKMLLPLIAVVILSTFVFAEVAPIPVKGKPAPVQAKTTVQQPSKKSIVKNIWKMRQMKRTKVVTTETTGKKK